MLNPLTIAGIGLVLSTLAGLVSLAAGVPFMTGLWIEPSLLGVTVPLSTVMLFDIGVYLVVIGGIGAIAMTLEEEEDL